MVAYAATVYAQRFIGHWPYCPWLSVNTGKLSVAGLPEEVAITKAALARSIDVLALTTKEQTYRCWDTEWPSKSEDIPRVRRPAGPHA